MTEIDHQVVKQQMVNILQAKTTLYDKDATDGTNKFTYLEVGEPNGTVLPVPDSYPGLWVTSSRPLETIKPSGTIPGSSHILLNHDVDYDIKYLINEADSIIGEQRLDIFQKAIMEALEADIRFEQVKWLVSATYATGDIVSHTGSLWQSKINSNTGNEPTDTAAQWTFLTRHPNNSWPSRVDTFRQDQDGTPLRGRVITWKCKFTT